MKRVLVTGATGFLGKYLVEELINNGYEVVAQGRKENILNNNGNIEFIDFDDAKYGESVIDISILIALLFFSKKRGVDLKGIQLFIDSYYGYDIELKKLEIKFIKKCALNWIDYTLKNNDLGISVNESFETKKKLIKEYL